MFDFSINLGNLLTIVAFLVGGISFVYAMRGQLDDLASRVSGLEKELKKMVDVLIMQGRHDERMAAMDVRITAQGQRLDDLTKRFNKVSNGEED